MRRGPVVLGAAALLGLGLSVVDSARDPRLAGAEDFQRLTGGLGMGASAAIYWDFASFDPRLEPDCGCALWPVPGGSRYSPEHRLTVWDPPEILWLSPKPAAGGEDGS